MVFDFDAAEKYTAELIRGKSDLMLLKEETEGIMKSVLKLDDRGDYSDIAVELKAEADRLDGIISGLQSLISALEGVSSVYKRSEKIILSKLSIKNKRKSKSVTMIDLESIVPKDISDLIRYNKG